MGPPSFLECFICQKEFGSRSLPFHEPQCLSRWHRNNNSLPKSERKRSPSPPLRYRSDSSHGSSPECLSQSSSKFMERRSLSRPSTATLDKPKILDVKMKNEIDMSKMSRQMMEELVIQQGTEEKELQKGSSDYSSDFSSSSSPLSSSSSQFDDEYTSPESGTYTKKRPSTMRLNRPSTHIAVPVIAASTSRPLPRRGRTATIRSNVPLRRRLEMAEEIIGNSKAQIKFPEPCRACGKEQKPERFHSHPRYWAKFKAKEKLAEDSKEKEKPKTINKLIVTKPTALKYKSKSSTCLETPKDSKTDTKLSETQTKSNEIKKLNTFESKSEKNSPQNPPWDFPTLSDKKSRLKKPLKLDRKSLDNSLQKSRIKKLERKRANPKPSVPVTIRPRKEKVEFEQNETTEKTIKKINEKTIEKINEKTIEKTTEKTPKNSTPPNRTGTGAALKICYVCGRQFGSRSLGIHEPQCLERWQRENDNLPSKLRREAPVKPNKEFTKEEWNEFAWKTAQNQLIPCGNCGRTFNPNRLEVHQRACKAPPGAAKKVQEQERKTKVLSPVRQSTRPTILCYICGREFGSRSITIHEPQCLIKWRIENEKLAPNIQRSDPVKPDNILDATGRVDKEAMEEAAWRSHLETLVKCVGCGRTFLPDRLVVHQKSCKLL